MRTPGIGRKKANQRTKILKKLKNERKKNKRITKKRQTVFRKL